MVLEEELENKMEQTQPVLTEPTIEENINHLRGLSRNNDLANKVLNQQTTFTQEAEDLFYFFNGLKQYLLSIIRTPKLRDNHDLRLRELQQALNIDLMTEQDYKEYRSLKTKRRPHINIFASNAFIVRDYHSSLETYRGLNGSLDTTILYESSLKAILPVLEKRSRVAVGLPLAIGIAELIYSIISANPSAKIGIPLGILLFATSLKNLSLTSAVYVPTSYHALHTKAKRADEFVEKYIFNG